MTRYEKAWQSLFYKESKIVAEQNALNAANQAGQKPAAVQTQALQGILTTINTELDTPVIFYDIGPDKKVKQTEIDTSSDVKSRAMKITSSDPNFTPADYWAAALKERKISFSLTYTLSLRKESLLGISAIPSVRFFPFQRGFFTRLEGAIDAALLREWTDSVISKIQASSATGSSTTTTNNLVRGLSDLSLTPTGSILRSQAGVATGGSPLPVSAKPLAEPLHHAVWKAATGGLPVTVGGATLDKPQLVTLNDQGKSTHIPLGPSNPTSIVDGMPRVRAVVASAPHSTPTFALPSSSPQAPSQRSSVPAPPAIVNPNNPSNIPKGFVLAGQVKVFGISVEQMYAYYGSAATGSRRKSE